MNFILKTHIFILIFVLKYHVHPQYLKCPKQKNVFQAYFKYIFILFHTLCVLMNLIPFVHLQIHLIKNNNFCDIL